MGLAVVARIVEQLGGQLRVDSNVNKGSHFSFLIPLTLCDSSTDLSQSPSSAQPLSAFSHSRDIHNRHNSGSGRSELDSLVGAVQPNHLGDATNHSLSIGSGIIQSTQTDTSEMDASYRKTQTSPNELSMRPGKVGTPAGPALVAEPHANPLDKIASSERPKLRVLIVEVQPMLVYLIKYTD